LKFQRRLRKQNIAYLFFIIDVRLDKLTLTNKRNKLFKKYRSRKFATLSLVGENRGLLLSHHLQVGESHTFRSVRQVDLWQHCPATEACAIGGRLVKGGGAEVFLRAAAARGPVVRVVEWMKLPLHINYF